MFHNNILSADLFKRTFSETLFQLYHQSVKIYLGPDQEQHFIRPDKGKKCLQVISTATTLAGMAMMIIEIKRKCEICLVFIS